jgi:lipopolysaccharide biosynthesis glycosyltransferase
VTAAGDKVKIFIGSGEQSLLERKVLIHSIRKHTSRDLDIRVFNGTHNAIESTDIPPVPAPLPLHLKYRSLTEFSLYRYLIPELCDFQGRAIYLDSDMICFADIGELFDTPMEDFDFLAKAEAYQENGNALWGPSVMLMDCSRVRFDLEQIYSEIDRGVYTYTEFSRFAKKFLAIHPFRIGKLDPKWNEFDRADSSTKLIHYTNLYTQPWKYPSHPYGRIWFSYFRDARKSGFIAKEDIALTIRRGYARVNLTRGNSPRYSDKFKYLWKKFKSDKVVESD